MLRLKSDEYSRYLLRRLRAPFLKRLSDECDRAAIISGQRLSTSLSLPLSTCTTSHLTCLPDRRQHVVRGIRLPNLQEFLKKYMSAWTFSLILASHLHLLTRITWPYIAASSILRPRHHDLPPRLSIHPRTLPTRPLHHAPTVRC